MQPVNRSWQRCAGQPVYWDKFHRLAALLDWYALTKNKNKSITLVPGLSRHTSMVHVLCSQPNHGPWTKNRLYFIYSTPLGLNQACNYSTWHMIQYLKSFATFDGSLGDLFKYSFMSWYQSWKMKAFGTIIIIIIVCCNRQNYFSLKTVLFWWAKSPKEAQTTIKVLCYDLYHVFFFFA